MTENTKELRTADNWKVVVKYPESSDETTLKEVKDLMEYLTFERIKEMLKEMEINE